MNNFIKNSKLSNKAKRCILNFISNVESKEFKVDYNKISNANEYELKLLLNYLIDMNYVSSVLKNQKNCGIATRNEILLFLGRKPIETKKCLVNKGEIKFLIESLEKIYTSNLGDEKLIASQVLKEYKNFLN